MKRMLAILLSALLPGHFCANAQSLSVEAGWQKTQLISTTVASDGFRSYLYTWSDGFYAGVSSSYSLPVPGFGFKYSILYNYSTGTESDAFIIFQDPRYNAAKAGEIITDEHYITVPAVLEYGISFSPMVKAFVFAGAEVMYCLSSKSWSSWPGIDGVNHWNVDHFGNGTNYNGYTRFDIGLLGGLGLEIPGRARAKAGVDYGLLDRSGKASDLLHRFSVSAGLAWLF